MEIPSSLIEDVKGGNAILFLGAGASLEARNSKGEVPPTGTELGAMLADRFLGGNYRDYPLSQISEYAISETDLFRVQDFIRNVFKEFKPTDTHLLLPTFRWRGLASTNYDLLVESSYEQSANRAQDPLVTFVENGDRVDEKLRDPNAVPYLKLHGCINRIANPACPLILSLDQYGEYRKGRSRVFDHLKTWAFENPIIFVGYGLNDPNIRQILAEVASESGSRPRYYLVSPAAGDIQRRFWEQKKITVIEGTFEKFLKKLDNAAPAILRGIKIQGATDHPISAKFGDNKRMLSKGCSLFLENDVDYVASIRSTEFQDPKLFYKGMTKNWSPIEQNLDVKRLISDTIIAEEILDTTHNGFKFILIRGHAGSGKSVLLQRLAWEAGKTYDKTALYLKSFGAINPFALNELIQATEKEVYLFVDDAVTHAAEIERMLSSLGENLKRLRLFSTARINEWNAISPNLSSAVTSAFDLEFLLRPEILSLLQLLKRHSSLGVLSSLSEEDQIKALTERAGRQLLVALHEATGGKPFEEIIANEYDSIRPLRAQQIYLTICTLNRLNVPVRAGLISRIYDITLEEFKNELHNALDQVVFIKSNPMTRDYVYEARHPQIAEMVFTNVLKDVQIRYDEFLKCFNNLNLDYHSDNTTFFKMTNAKTLLHLFPEHQMVHTIFKIGREKAPDNYHLFHQNAIYEMRRPNGNLEEAENLLKKSFEMAPWSYPVAHSLAELCLKKADMSRTNLEAMKYISEVELRCSKLLTDSPGSYGFHTIVKAQLKKLDILLQDERPPTDSELQVVLRDIEDKLEQGLKRYPDDAHLLGAEAEVAQRISDSERAIAALQKSFKNNPRNKFAAIRLSKYYIESKNRAEATRVLKEALDAAPGEKQLHLEYGKLLMNETGYKHEDLIYHFRRAYTPGDKSYDAQLLHARSLFLNGNFAEAKSIFVNSLAYAKVAWEVKTETYYPVSHRYRGTVSRVEASYFFIMRDGDNEWIYAHQSKVSEYVWNRIELGIRIEFDLAFSFKGPSALNAEIVS
ncbi:SIR2 family protein [Bdellovibrio sp. HCB-110]|uniref:P-loop NTPase n=1 Tax=Bdellovibrio sp. HCB-110 TaxID=3391182 RepID=UPI0039B4F0C9